MKGNLHPELLLFSLNVLHISYLCPNCLEINKTSILQTINISVKEQCLVLFPYTAQEEDELSLKEGQLITIITKDCEDEGWWKGEIEGKVGLFPDNFVKRVSQNMSEEVKRRISGQLSASKYFIKIISIK